MPHELSVDRWGDGPPVVLLHGLGASARYWGRLRAELEDRWHGIAPDLLGFGRSPKPADSPYDVEAHLSALAPVIPDGAVIVAHSTGSVLAAALAARSEHDVRALVLVGCPAYPDEATAISEIGRLGTLARLSVRGSAVARWVCWFMCELRPLLTPFAPLLARDLPHEVAGDFLRHTWTSYLRTLENVVVSHRVVPDLLQARTPVVFVHGGDDEAAPLAHVEAAARRLRAAGAVVDVVVEPGADHHIAVRRPELVAAAVMRLR